MFENGISFQVKPDKHQWKQYGNLSGGQKALAGFALTFAACQCFPSSIYLFDEVDASMDSLAATNVANFLAEQKCQVVLCSHKPQLYEANNFNVVGVFNFKGMAKVVQLT